MTLNAKIGVFMEIDWQFVNRNCYRLSHVSWALAQISCFTLLYFYIKCSYYFVLFAVYYAGESLFEVKIEADSNDITEHPHDDKPTIESKG